MNSKYYINRHHGILIHIAICLILLLSFIKESYSENPVDYYETISLVSDRNIYISGELIWFKTYLETETPKQEFLSKILYLELLDNEWKPIVQKKYSISNGSVSGAIVIPEEVKSGTYLLRAYTKYMMNYPPELYAYLPVVIINPEYPLSEHNDNNDDIIIAIEGKRSIGILHSTFALYLNERILDKTSKLLVCDENGNILSTQTKFHGGLSTFDLLPADTIEYFVKALLNNGDTITRSLQLGFNDGERIVLQPDDNHIKIHLDRDEPVTTRKYKVSVFSKSYKKLYESSIISDAHRSTLNLSRSLLDNGLHYIRLQDSRDSLITIQAFFNQADKQKNIQLTPGSSSYNPRKEISLDVKSFCEIDNASISVSLKDPVNNDSILPYYLINNPVLLNDTYGNKIMTDQIRAALIIYNNNYIDEEYLNLRFDSVFDPYVWIAEVRGLSISGSVIDKATRKPVADALVIASVLYDDRQFHFKNSDAKGRFIIPLNDFPGVVDLYAGIRPDEASYPEILINRDFSTAYPEFSNIRIPIGTSNRELIESMYTNYQLNKKFGTDGEQSCNISFSPRILGDAAITIYLKDYISLNNLEEVFNEIIPYTKIKKRKGKYLCTVFDIKSNFVYEEPLIFVDNIPVFNIEEVLNIHPSKVDNIKIINKTYIYGDQFLQGIVSIETNTDNFGGIKTLGSNFLEFQGLNPGLKFSEMHYTENEVQNNKLPDFRNLLYWNPDFTIHPDGSIVSFYASDCHGEYEIIVSGKDQNGDTYYGSTYITISQ